MAAVPKPVFPVQVRELVEFALRRGDLGGARDFVGRDRALAGMRGHQRLQRSRPAGYQKEVPVSHEVETEEFVLRIQGRIDGLLVTPDEVLLEEIKTIQGGWDRAADPLHWAQAKVYAFIYAHDHALESIVIQLAYLELESAEVTEFRERHSFAELSRFFTETAAIYLEWIRERFHWCQQRDKSIRALTFPFPRYRPGQRELAVAAYRTLARGGRLFLEAPTGIGKTISALFPAVKALGEGKLERIFYLTARTVGRAVAEKTFADLRDAGLRLRTVTLTAKDKICFQEGQPCDAASCPFAHGYYDRLRPALREARGREEITRAVLEAVGHAHQVCPFELSLDVSSWADAVVCDYNYVFDPKVYLRRHFADEAGDHGFLVDEAHNLVDRAREMFSADLDGQELREVRRAIKDAVPRCARALSKLGSALRKLGGTNTPAVEPSEADELSLFPSDTERAAGILPADRERKPADKMSAARSDGVRTVRDLPSDLLPLLETALQEAEAWLARNQPAEFRESLLELYFRLRSFQRTAELYDERYVTIIEPGAAVRVRLFCLDPSFLLRQALARGKAAVFFSATLTPLDYYRDLLGGEADDPAMQLPSPFPPENLAVLVQDRLRTHFKARAESLADVVQAIGAAVAGRAGNYLVYLPSYQYLAAVQEQFHALHPTVPILVQRPGLSEAERDDFLAAFTVEEQKEYPQNLDVSCAPEPPGFPLTRPPGTLSPIGGEGRVRGTSQDKNNAPIPGKPLVGFAVMGGIFGEGIDLVGDRLIGAIIVGVGLPQLCVERDLIRDYFQVRCGAGFDYAYTFPGMNRVLQAIGRVIRSETDRGVALLIDARFAEARYRRLFPRWWQPARVRSVREIAGAVDRFWAPAPRLTPPAV